MKALFGCVIAIALLPVTPQSGSMSSRRYGMRRQAKDINIPIVEKALGW